MSKIYKNIQVSTEWMVYPNPYFFFRALEKADLAAIACWMAVVARRPDGGELRILRQLKWYYGFPVCMAGSDPGDRALDFSGPGDKSWNDPGTSVRNSWIAVVAGVPAFLLECTITGEVYLTGASSIHASPWKALEAWGYSLPWVFAQQGFSRLRMPLPDSRVAEIRALKRLGCRRKEQEVDFEEGVWVWAQKRP